MPKKTLFVLLTLACLLPQVTTPMALSAGLAFGLIFGSAFADRLPRYTKILLQASVVGLGFGIPIRQVIETGQSSLVVAISTIAFGLGIGYVLATMLRIRSNASSLITVGTAICGGSAIAAIAPTIKAKPEEMSVALAAVFSLNALALFVFPWVGKATAMSPEQFGLWSALAIHDTSSVVGAASTFGATALTIATTVKLSRVIWIVPIAAGFALLERQQGKIAIPWFILFFLVAAALRTALPPLESTLDGLSHVAKQSLCIVLFWVGTGLNKEALSKVGIKPFVFAVSLWIALATLSFFIATY
jgi:uncharacterized integral membrane protein (TIGR00698 family)